jgi:predicted nucleic acid-binding protein
MLLVDSTVWIDWLNGADTDAVRFIQGREGQEELALTQMIYLEVLQGIASVRQFAATQRVLGSQVLLLPAHPLETFESAAHLYRRARTMGLTIRKSSDCLIAAISLEQQALLVHNDRDFFALGQAEPGLRIYPAAAARPH